LELRSRASGFEPRYEGDSGTFTIAYRALEGVLHREFTVDALHLPGQPAYTIAGRTEDRLLDVIEDLGRAWILNGIEITFQVQVVNR